MTPNFSSPYSRLRYRARSLRVLFVLGTSVMLLPLLILALLGYLKFEHVVQRMDNVVHGVFLELVPLGYLENATQRARYLTHRSAYEYDKALADEFEQLAIGIGVTFEQIESNEVPLPVDILADIRLAHGAWQRVRRDSRPMFEASPQQQTPKRNAPLLARFKMIDAELEDVEFHLHSVHARVLQKIDAQLLETRETQGQVLALIFIVAVVGLSAAILAAYFLARSILIPLTRLQDTAARLAGGDLGSRVPKLAGREFTQLAATFNNMAEMLQHHQADLRRMAIHDALTGLFNRREFRTRLHQEIERSRRYAHSFALLLIDADHFKAVNDTHGHPAGDQALREIARVLADSTRPVDTVARYGGEEFALLLPETQGEGAFITAERIRRTMEAVTISLDDGVRLKLTVSIGIGLFPQHGPNADHLFARADAALYEAKEQGRNRVVMARRVEP